MKNKTILVLGGGLGGVVAATELRENLNDNHRIVMFDKQPQHLYAPSLLWLMVGKRKPQKVTRDLNRLQQKGIEFVNGEITNIDPDRKMVTVNETTYSGNYMIISLGAELTDSPSLKQTGHNFYTLEGAKSFWRALSQFEGGKVVVLVSAKPFKCPAAPYEAALLINDYLQQNDISAEVELYTPEADPMGVAGEEVSENVQNLVEHKGIKYFPEHQWSGISDKKTLRFDNGTETTPDLLAYVPEHRCPQVIRETNLVGESGWIALNDNEMMTTDYEGVYAIGDATGVTLPAGKSLPKAGVFAHKQAETVAHNIATDINEEGSLIKFSGEGQCFLETGSGKAGFASGNFYADPEPDVTMKNPGMWWHWAKIWFEKYWWFKYF
ncbi:NAD(P)/FAD-dependent oxidoreductase [Fodinibius sp. AD559]|uniref:NAD(P)/FAD-dependent oxidoreductase n=1 Tax=Fodinibius sp. AD559 TaxID=3424179 RepID=UPI004046D9F9